MNQLPNTITCLNVLSGTVAIIMATRQDIPQGPFTGIEWAWIFIGIAAVADFCDGFAARLLHAYSNLGKELDSLCDLVSFGVAPAIVTIFSLQACAIDDWRIWIPVLIPVAAALRLAKFNIDTRQSTSFLGLPVPANAIFWIGYSSLIPMNENLSLWFILLPVVLIMCFMMVSEIKLFSLKVGSLSLSVAWRQLLTIAAAIILVIFCGVSGLMWLILFYLTLSIFTIRN